MPRSIRSKESAGEIQDRGIFKYGERVLWSLSNPAHYLPTKTLDHLLRSVRLSAVIPGHANLSAPFGVDVAYGADSFVIYEAHQGDCNVAFDLGVKPIKFKQGDLLLIPCDMKHCISSSLGAPSIDLRDLLGQQIEPHVEASKGHPSLKRLLSQQVNYGGGGEVFALRMVVMFVEQETSSTLLSGLRGPILLKGSANKHRLFLSAIFDEFNVQCKSGVVSQPVATRLTEALLTIILTEATKMGGEEPFYKGLNDPAVARVMRAVFSEPERDWGLHDLVDIALVSRTVLNSRFHELVDMSPRQFVCHVRLSRASEMLIETSLSIATIAERSNYGSEAAFNRAFRRWCGMTPGMVRKKRVCSPPTSVDAMNNLVERKE